MQSLYQWPGITPAGKKIKGVRHATSAQDAKLSLVDDDYVKVKCNKVFFAHWSRHHIKQKDRITVLNKISTLLHAGISLNKALQLTQQSTHKLILQEHLRQLIQQTASGKTLAQALHNTPGLTNTIDQQQIFLAEETGQLDTILTKITRRHQRQLDTYRQIKKALTYPATIILIGIIVSTIMITTVLPKFAALYQNLNTSLPKLTQLLLSLSHFLKDNGIMLAIIIVLFTLGLTSSKASTFRNKIRTLTCYFPLFGKLIKAQQQLNWCDTFIGLLDGGVPIDKALEYSQSILQNDQQKNAIRLATKAIQSGTPLSSALDQTKLFSRTFIQLIKIGEQTGNISTLLHNYLKTETLNLTTLTEQLSSLLEPITMLIVGAMIGLLVTAMYLPIMEMGNAL